MCEELLNLKELLANLWAFKGETYPVSYMEEIQVGRNHARAPCEQCTVLF